MHLWLSLFGFSGVPTPFTGNEQIHFETSKTASSIQVEKQNKVTHKGLLSPPPPGSNTTPTKPYGESTPKHSSSKSPYFEEKSMDAVVQVEQLTSCLKLRFHFQLINLFPKSYILRF